MGADGGGGKVRFERSAGSQEELTGESREAASTANPLMGALGRRPRGGGREGVDAGQGTNGSYAAAGGRRESMEIREAAALRVVTQRPRTSLPRQSSGRWAMSRLMLDEEDADDTGRRRPTGPVSPKAGVNDGSSNSIGATSITRPQSPSAIEASKQLSPLM